MSAIWRASKVARAAADHWLGRGMAGRVTRGVADWLDDWRLLTIGGALLFAVAVWAGEALAHRAVDAGVRAYAPIESGAWTTMLRRTRDKSDPLVLAVDAVRGPLALPSREGLNLRAVTDSDGRELTADAVYEVTIPPLPGRYWSLAVTDPEGVVLAETQARHAITSADGATGEGAGGGIVLTVAHDAGNGLTLDPGEAEAFALVLRLYDPSAEAVSHLSAIALPVIRRIGGRS